MQNGKLDVPRAGAEPPLTLQSSAPPPATLSAYQTFILRKSQADSDGGFAPLWMPDFLFDLQSALVEWSLRKGRAAIYADCGLGKTPMELVWSENVLRKTGRSVLILTPLAVAAQTVREGAKFGIEAKRVTGPVTAPSIYVTNYERLHHLDANDFGGVVCDESSILKSFAGETKKAVTRFMLKVPYRLLATATAAPNDYIELGTSSEALGHLGYSDMLTRFFKQTDNKGSRIDDVKRSRKDREIEVMGAQARQAGGDYFAKLSYRVAQDIGGWRMKGHAVEPFWRWVASWARACRKPSDLGFDDTRFVLPELIERHHVVKPLHPPDGMLFVQPAFGLQEEREERRRTLTERCELAASLVTHGRPAVVWCHLNVEGDMLTKIIPGAVQVSGADSDDAKEEAYEAFTNGRIRCLVTKPKIGAWGLNWAHCADTVTFASHSFEQHYQSVRRFWRFGQTRPVTVDIISTEGEVRVRDSLARKSHQADEMFTELVKHMQDATRIARRNDHTKEPERVPWLQSSTK